MGKFRSKLKRSTKGKHWRHGQSATTNPANKKHRLKARSRFFQPNLSLVPQTDTKSSPLTLDAVLKHDAKLSYAIDNEEPTVQDIAASLKSFCLDGGQMTEFGTFKTFQTFASNYTTCTNMSFSKLLNGFRNDSPLHKEMLAILAALTEVIKERGGTETSTEYFLALMETLDTAREDQETIAAISLLGMGIKTVPQPVLRKTLTETGQLLCRLMERFVSGDQQNVLRSIIGCMSVVLRAQNHSDWMMPSVLELFDAILAFVTHSRPKVRKAAQHAITAIIHGSCFMIGNETMSAKFSYHPAGTRLAKFCVKQFKPEVMVNSQTTILHTLGLLQDTIGGMKNEDIKMLCEHLLSIMTAANVLIRTACFHTFHSLFGAKTNNLSATLCGKLISAIYEYRPEKLDARQTIAWITVLKESHICLFRLDQRLCINSLPKFIDLLSTDLWLTDRMEIVQSTSTCIREILFECLRPAIETEQSEIYRVPITKIIQSISKSLSVPFGPVVGQVVLIFASVFEVCGSNFPNELIEPLQAIGDRYDSDTSSRIQIEHAISSAIPTMGPENVLKAIKISDNDGNVLLSRSWLLPLLRESIHGATLEYFTKNILQLAAKCYTNWKQYKLKNDLPLAHTNELLCCQLWGLFPGFCRKPKDIAYFRSIAKTLGTVLNDNPELRAPVLDGMKELLVNVTDDSKVVLERFAKNFLPRLFNIYSTKATTTYDNDLRVVTLDVIKEYLKITPTDTLNELFASARGQHKTAEIGSFISESVFDIIKAMAPYQSAEQLNQLYDEFITVVLLRENRKKNPIIARNVDKLKRQQRKAYELLYDIMQSDNDGCRQFVEFHLSAIETLLLTSLRTTCNTTQIARLNCLNILIEKRASDVQLNDDLIRRTVPEVIVAWNHGATKKENVAQNLIIKIGDRYKEAGKLNEFVDVIMAGFGGDSILIKNTILTLKSIVQHFAGQLTVNTLAFVLEQIVVFLVGRHRPECEAAIVFLIVFIKVLPAPLVANHLENIVKSLSAMVPDTRRYCRLHFGYVLKKLCKRYGAEEIVKLVPGNDELMHKKLKNIRKEMARMKRRKATEPDESDDDDLLNGLERKSHTIDDILADSDSDGFDGGSADDEGKGGAMGGRKKGKQQTYIQEDPESIVDLADINAIGKITTVKPQKFDPTASGSEKKQRVKDPNRGFKIGTDGRLIIAEPKRNQKQSNDSDDDDDDDAIETSAIDEKMNATKKRAYDASDSSDEEEQQTARKRKAIGTSVASGRSGYQPGGKGIHRPLGGQSMKSGATSRVSMATTKVATGSEFKAKKAFGDVKRKGKMDPYAYIPMNRNALNRRKRAKHAGQFKSIVKGARKGAAAGKKNKIRMASKM